MYELIIEYYKEMNNSLEKLFNYKYLLEKYHQNTKKEEIAKIIKNIDIIEKETYNNFRNRRLEIQHLFDESSDIVKKVDDVKQSKIFQMIFKKMSKNDKNNDNDKTTFDKAYEEFEKIKQQSDKEEADKMDKENTKLNEELIQVNKLKQDLDKYKKENEKLNEELIKAKKIITNLSINQLDINELQKLRDENNNLKLQLNTKDKEIQDLKNVIKNNKIEVKNVNFEDIMVINFISQDSSVHYGIKCLPDDVFAEIEEKLYKKYNNLRETNNTFMANARPVLRFKKLNENNIHDGDIIQLFQLE